MGTPHGFAGSVGKLKAAAQTLDPIGAYLAERLDKELFAVLDFASKPWLGMQSQ
jgi:hypothetical protein